MPRYDVVSLGEGQIRLTVPRGENLLTAKQLYLTAAGSEANVTGLLSQLGHSCAWASVIPKSELGDRIVREYRAVGTDVSHIVRTDTGRVALYFLQPGADPMPAEVVYDRLHTPFREIEPEIFDWGSLLDTRILFITGITMALTEKTRRVIEYGVACASERGVDIVLDVNHRARLWSGKEARGVIVPLLDKVKILFCSRGDADRVFGITGEPDDVARTLRARYGVPTVVSTAGTQGVYLSSATGEESFPVTPVRVIDRPGAGDAFVGGSLHGHLSGDLRMGIKTGMLAAQHALSHYGDLVSTSAFGEYTSTDILR